MFSSSTLLPKKSFAYYFSRTIKTTVDRSHAAWTFYSHHVNNQPRITASLTGGTLWALSDLYVQKRIEKVDKFDTGRFLGCVIYGTVVTGFLAFYWYTFLEKLVHYKLNVEKGTLKFVAAKVGLELGVFAPASLFSFWYILGKSEGKRYKDILEQMENDNKYWESLKLDWMIWLPIDALNFWLVRVRYQILVVNLGCVVEAIILGKMEAAAAKKEEEEAERKRLHEMSRALAERSKHHHHSHQQKSP